MTTKYIVIRPGKYAGKRLEIGDEFIPNDGLNDAKIMDPENKFVRIVEVEEEKPQKKKPVKKKKAPAKKAKFKCDYCDRDFTTPQGKAAHTRFCKEKE
jgi:hypothetical protein